MFVTEGIETAAAVAFAFSAEIAAGEVAIAAAISASGMEAFQPYPATTRVTLAADRDESVKANGNPGSRRGESAARAFGIRHHARLRIVIAMPGDAGDVRRLARRPGPRRCRVGSSGPPRRGSLRADCGARHAQQRGRMKTAPAAGLGRVSSITKGLPWGGMSDVIKHGASNRCKRRRSGTAPPFRGVDMPKNVTAAIEKFTTGPVDDAVRAAIDAAPFARLSGSGHRK